MSDASFYRWQQHKAETGIGSANFQRGATAGVSKPTTRPEYSGRPMRGFAYGTVIDGEFVLFTSQDLAVHARGSLPVAEASVLTVRVK